MTNKDTADSFNSSPLKTAPKGKTHLLAIAIDDYKQCSILNNAVRDVETFIELMCTRYTLKKDNVTFIQNEKATKEAIEAALDNLIDIVGAEDSLIVYFSGHGRYNERRGGFWVPVEAGSGEKDWIKYISNNSVKDFLGKIKNFHTFLIVDACFSGTFVIEASRNAAGRVDTLPSRWVLTSGKDEIVGDGKSGGHSPFAKALLETLRHAQTHIGVLELCEAVRSKVIDDDEAQTPLVGQLSIAGNKGGQMVLYLREDEDQAWISTQADNTLQAYLAYRKRFPQGKYSKAANAKIAELEEQHIWGKVRKNRMADLLYYIDDNPHSPFVEEAKNLVIELEKRHMLYSNTVKPKPTLEVPLAKVETLSLIVPDQMVFVKGGTFEMGDVLAEGENRESPIHAVQIADFYLSANLVTQAQWEKIMGYNPSHFKDALLPIDSINWQEVQEFIRLLNKQSEMNYRLPSEAEWEYAARERGDKMRFGNGKNLALATEINFDSNKKDNTQFYVIKGGNWGKTTPIGSFPPNSLGLYDMSGNLWEWCADVWHENYYNAPQDGSAWVLGGEQSMRVIRGGSWADEGASCRTTFRLEKKFDGIDKDYFNVGFRLARHP